MDKSIIKNFAIWARRRLIEQVTARAAYYGIYKGIENNDTDEPDIQGFSSYEMRERKKIIWQLEKQGFDELMEEIAYTWFNRFAALYYMEINGYLDAVPLFSDKEGAFSPRILENEGILSIEGAGRDTIKKYLSKNDSDGLYRYLLFCKCNALKGILPEIFKPESGYTELLCPTGLLETGSVLSVMVNEIDKSYWKGNIEIISRLYQFYNTEPKDKAFAMLKNDQKLTKERIPEATQLFTPEWIVGYMVENTLGRYWMEKKNDYSLLPSLKYYMESPENESLIPCSNLKPCDIRFIDPCMGSGHILIYAFALLMDIYTREGIAVKEAVRSILKNNLYGLDIDERACQLASFSVMMKACSYDRSILAENIRPHFYTVTDSSFIDDALIDFVAGENEEYRSILDTLRTEFRDAEEFGSIIKLPDLELESLIEHVSLMDVAFYSDIFSMFKYQTIQNRLLPFLKQAQMIKNSYNVVVTNPPYMALSNMDTGLSAYVKREYKDSKKDMYAVFMEKCGDLLAEDGYMALITQHTWMFISSYLKLRKKLYEHFCFLHMLHLGTRAFEEISGEVVQTSTWVMRHKSANEFFTEVPNEAYFMKLDDVDGKREKEIVFLENKDKSECSDRIYKARISDFKRIPGMPLAYWTGKEFAGVYERLPLEIYADVTNGLFTCDNKRFLKYWYEVDYTKIKFDCASKEECIHSKAQWFPYNKGGGYRRWYGNQEYVVSFENFGEEIADFRQERGQSRSFPGARFYFRPSISWSLVSPSNFSVRYYPEGFVFDIAGSSVFVKQKEQVMPMLGILASDTIHTLMKISNPTINFQCGDVRSLPFEPELLKNEELKALVEENVRLAKEDWDSFETSWNFARHPLCYGTSLRNTFVHWKAETERRFVRVWQNETRISRIVAEGYGLETDAYVYPESEVTMYRADQSEEAKSFISYAAGCMLGRYSLDCEGIAFAGGSFDENKYITFQPEKTVVLYGDEEKDILSRLKDFLKALFGEEGLEEDLIFLSEGISKEVVSGLSQAEKILKRYFRTQFIKDHNKRYHNAPIYKAQEADDGSKILTYIHRKSNHE